MKRVLCAIGCVVAMSVIGNTAAQDYPAKSVRFVLPFPPGGGTDTLARYDRELSFAAIPAATP